MRTYSPKKNDFEEKWYLVDAKDQILGRIATHIATLLRGKHLPEFAPHMSPRTHVIVVNADQVRLTGRKLTRKKYYHHTGYPGGIRSTTPEKLLEKKPEELIRHAVRGMIPKNRLGRVLMKNLRIYPGPDHRHKAQKPETIKIETRKAREE